VAVERVKAKLDGIPDAKRKVAADMSGCKMERAAIGQACQDVATFGELRDFFASVDEDSKFVDVQGVLRVVVDCITVDTPASRLYYVPQPALRRCPVYPREGSKKRGDVGKRPQRRRKSRRIGRR